MKKTLIIYTLTFGLLSCNNYKENQTAKSSFEEEQKKFELDKLKLDFNQPILVDSSIYVMYPLTLESSKESGGSTSSSNGYNRQTTYWNIIFYNTENGQYHLLSDSLKMLIYSYNSKNTNTTVSSSAISLDDSFNQGQVDKMLYFSITTKDYNNDSILNSDDPNYLYISDKTGNNFKQISPNDLKISNWEIIKGTNKILMMAIKDSNGDRKFTDNDESFPLVYDLTKNSISREIFTDEFKTKLKMRLKDQWKIK